MKQILLFWMMLILGCIVKTENTRSYQFVYEVDIESTEGKKLEVWLPVPQSNEVQTIYDIEIKTNGLQYTIEDEEMHHNKYLYINHKIGTTKPIKLTMSFNVIRKEHQNVHYININPHKYLGSYTMVPVHGIFDKIIIDNKLSKYNVRGIYDYVLDGMHYAKPKSFDNEYYHEPWLSDNGKYGIKGVNRDEVVILYKKAIKVGGDYTFGNGNSIYACDIGVGNCTDFHSYFMSLNRTIGIPARFHMGFSIPDSEGGEVDGYHCWADYYEQDEGWYPVDISAADKDPAKKDYFFGTVDNNRLEMMVGRDFKLKGYSPEIANLFIYPIIEVGDETSSAFIKSFHFNNISQ